MREHPKVFATNRAAERRTGPRIQLGDGKKAKNEEHNSKMGNSQPSSNLGNKDRRMGYIYMFTSPSGKGYIGQTYRDVEKRKKEHMKCSGGCILLENAILKYGDKMEFEILLEVNDDKLDYYEKKLIEAYQTCEPNGYNVRSGGSNGVFSEEARKRMSDAKLGEKNHNFGKPRSDETKLAISEAKSGEKHHFYGKTFTEEHKLRLSASHKERTDLPMYVVSLKPRPECYQAAGYAVLNHPTLKKKYFTSKKLSDQEKLNAALEYLNSV